ncbi:hypothetical protein [Peterkaempfera griseoplana]|uniref:hypothetical protein n=1 Tax=Peterkaempfera griseoplana TaxID=66896 RepID=UPI0006E21170|nr:hypothetical protein [Peterkaempfera griseoplana]
MRSTDVEDALRREFAARAGRLPEGGRDPYAEVTRRIAGRRRAAAAAAGVLVLGAAVVGAVTALGGSRSAPPASVVVDGGCGSTPVRRGGAPAWTASAHAPADLPYVVSAEGNAVGFLFVDRLLAGPHQGGAQNKILWVLRGPGTGPLDIDAHPLGSGEPRTHQREPGYGAGSYPSITDMPAPGCWRLTLDWGGSGTATVDLRYGRPDAAE